MAVITKEDLLNKVKTFIGEVPTDEGIAFLEDLADTVSDLETKAEGDGEDWKAKHEELDATWKKKYTDRFYSGEEKKEKPKEEEKKDDEETPAKKDDELFEKK